MVEHKNKTIVETAKSMMKDKGLPKEFWVEAVAVVVYVLNRFLTCSVKGKTPYEAWSGRKPNVSHLKIFGSIAYSFVPSQLRKKLDEKSIKCIFVGYNEEIKG